jgi:hypothetical protein
VRKDLDKLFDVVAKAVTTNHKPPYDDPESLRLLAPLLTVNISCSLSLSLSLLARMTDQATTTTGSAGDQAEGAEERSDPVLERHLYAHARSRHQLTLNTDD